MMTRPAHLRRRSTIGALPAVTRSETLAEFVESYARKAGFTGARVEHATHLAMTHVYLDDDVVDEHAAFMITDRDLARYAVSDVLRRVAYEIDLARREVVRRVTGAP